jgi:hypothetical protein
MRKSGSSEDACRGHVLSKKRISSPASTGGAGTFFEQHVAAYWLAQLLVRSIPPILIDCQVAEVHFQTEHLGWHTDDFLIECERAGKETPKLAGQVKRTFTVSAADDDCKQVVQDFWSDFKNGKNVRPERDRLVLVTLRGTNTLLEHFGGLLDCARAARGGVEFEARLGAEGFISKTAVRYCGELQKIIGEIERNSLNAADIWSFLCVVHVLSLDLHTSTQQTEANIKNLLAHTVTEGDPLDAADASWNELLAFASKAMDEARSLRRDAMPEELQRRHKFVGPNEQRILRALKEHTDLIFRGIRPNLGQSFHLARAALTQKVLTQLQISQVVLLSGPAGSGKSVIGKEVATLLSGDHFVFGFRGEEFAQAHLDATLHAGQIPANGSTLGAILAGQGRKIVVVESVERLLEKPTRDAFGDFMTLASADAGILVVLTCRDYSIDQVRASFLNSVGMNHAVVTVPLLDDAELTAVEVAFPMLLYPLKNLALRGILRNPYFLDKALEISWSTDRPVPESERELRALFWRQIVRADQRVSAGMARRREQAFQEIAVRRARSLSAHVVCNDLDPEAVAALVHDSLINSPDNNPSLAATAHDVLEDWAILRWIEEQNLILEGSFEGLAVAIGGHPAIRRSYRKWLSELIDCDPAAADRLFTAAIAETEIGAQFRDDTLVSLLKSPSSPDFLARHEGQLKANKNALLKRVVHLLRVACMTTPAWLQPDASLEWTVNVPDGPAWATVLSLVYRNLDGFVPKDHLLIIGLIEDAVRNISERTPDIPLSEYVAGIAHWLMPGFDGYRAEKALKRVLKVIAKIPKADPVRFEVALRGTIRDGERRDPIADDFRVMLLSGLDGFPAGRDLPGVILSVASDYLLASEDDFRGDRYSGTSMDVEKYFGIKQGRSYDSSPASALRGPWMSVLRYHPHEALDFFTRIFNHSVDWYAHPRFYDPLEPAWQVELTFADGTTRKQWVNLRLWNLYRGLSVGPDVLQSLLMALERWLLEYAEEYPQQLDSVLVDILRRSESAAVASVVASAATAHPHASGEALLVLLSASEYVRFDLRRMVSEQQTGAMSSMFSGLQAENKIYEEERKKADLLPHRAKSLEDAIMNLQLGPLAPRVLAILDGHRAALPPIPQQDDGNRRWRLAIHRMDLRQYKTSEVEESETTAAGHHGPPEPPRSYIRLDPTEPEPDVKAMMDEAASRHDATLGRLRLFNWAHSSFKNEDSAQYDPGTWQQFLPEAMLPQSDSQPATFDGTRGGPGILAAVCIRDHWEEMSAPQRDWCSGRACAEVMADSNQWNSLNRGQRFGMAADRPCAWILSLLLTKSITEKQGSHVQEAFAAAMTHPTDEVRWHAVLGVAHNRSGADREIVERCINALSMQATLIETERHAQDNVPYKQRRKMDDIAAMASRSIREVFWEPHGISPVAYEELNIDEWFGADANAQILTIFSSDPDNPAAVAAFVRASLTLVRWWDAGDNRHREQAHTERNREAETALSRCLQTFVMRTSYESARSILEPILGAIDGHSREIHWIIQGLTGIEDSSPNTPHYWRVWELFANGIKRSKWISRLSDDHQVGSDIMSVIFLTSFWKDNVRHWRSLEGHGHHILALFEALPPSWIVLDSYVRFLYHIGERSLPQAFVSVANSLKAGEAKRMLADENTVFLLEVLLQRHVYGKPLELKREPVVRHAVLYLLDTLVDAGSPAAFRMRDDFVTPVAA